MLVSNPLISTSSANTSPNQPQQLDGQQFELNASPNGIQASLADQQAAASVISSVGQVRKLSII
jgi:hypothetical protein